MKIICNEDHIYTVDGVVKDSVTQILSAEGFTNYHGFNDDAVDKGRKVHKTIELFEKGKLLFKPGAWYTVYLKAWLKAKEELKITDVLCSEELLYSKIWDFCGQLDFIVQIKNIVTLLDLKTGSKWAHYPLQTAGYALAAKEHLKINCKQRCCLYLKDGNYNIEYHNNKNDFNVFKSAVICHNWKKGNK